MKRYVLAIDQGTTSSRSIIFDEHGKIVAMNQREIPMIYPKEGFVEQNPFDIWMSVLSTMAQAMIEGGISPEEVASIGITNQRETTILWDRTTGNPIYNAIVWQSSQSMEICEKYKQKGYEQIVHEKTGLLIDPYFSATKIVWMLEHVPFAKEKMAQGNLMFGTVDSWLLYKLTEGKEHKTDFTNASRTMLFNIHEKQWDEDLLDLFKIKKSILPEVVDSNALFGTTTKRTFFGSEVPITAMIGDQQAALLGQLCLEEGNVKNTYGTGCFLLMNTGEKPILSSKGLLTTIAYSFDGQTTYALEGSVFVAGSAILWLRDQLNFFADAPTSETLATSVNDHLGIYVVPAFVGLGTPYWDPNARGAIFGLTRASTKAHIARATLESLAFQTKDIVTVMEEESNIKTTSLKVDGGASKNDYLMQFQADILNVFISRPTMQESTALGAAYVSGLKSGLYKDWQQLKKFRAIDQTFMPKMSTKVRNQRYETWKRAVQATRLFGSE